MGDDPRQPDKPPAPSVEQLVTTGAFAGALSDQAVLNVIKDRLPAQISVKEAERLIKEHKRPTDGPEHRLEGRRIYCFSGVITLLITAIVLLLIVGDEKTKDVVLDLVKYVGPLIVGFYGGKSFGSNMGKPDSG
jgi:hypothetical protein